MNIAIFGGSFDPPHQLHDLIVKTSLKNLDIDKLIIIPTFLNPFKDKFFAPPDLRLKWCETLWGNLEKVQISDYEINQKRPVKSYESVKFFKDFYKASKIYLIIGADNLESLEKWYKFDELSKLVEFVFIPRNNVKIPSNLHKLNINGKISSSEIRKYDKFDFVPAQIREEILTFYKGKKCKKN